MWLARSLSCKFGKRLLRKSSNNLDLPCGLSRLVVATVVRFGLAVFSLVNSEFVEPNIALADSPAATEFARNLASAPGAAERTLELTRPPSCRGAAGGGVRLPVRGLGLLPSP